MAEGWQTPHALSEAKIAELVTAFAHAARRSVTGRFIALEIHGAHDYLIHRILSPLSNQRNDGYGSDRADRMRFALEDTEAVRAAWPEGLPLFSCLSAVDGRGWEIDDTVVLSVELKARGVDVVDCSTGGITGAPAFRAKDDGTPPPRVTDRWAFKSPMPSRYARKQTSNSWRWGASLTHGKPKIFSRRAKLIWSQ